MAREHIIRIFAGTFILIGLAGFYFHSTYWLFLPLFVALNLIQSAITRWCLLEDILKKLDLGRSST